MKHLLSWFGTAAIVASLGMLLGVMSVSADTVTDVNLSSFYNNNWTSQTNGTLIAAAPTSGNTGTGITFGDWAGSDVAISPVGVSNTYEGSATGTLPTPILLNSDAVVNTLMSNFFGTANTVEAVVTFTNSNGQTAVFSLVGDQTIRDYNNYIYTNLLQGYNTNSSYGQVTAQEWWNDNSTAPAGTTVQRLDAQTFVLPSSWAGTDLTQITITDPTTGDWDVLSALQVDDRTVAAPEPGVGGLTLIGVALSGLLVVIRKRISRGLSQAA